MRRTCSPHCSRPLQLLRLISNCLVEILPLFPIHVSGIPRVPQRPACNAGHCGDSERCGNRPEDPKVLVGNVHNRLRIPVEKGHGEERLHC